MAAPTVSDLALDLSLSNQEGTSDFLYFEYAGELYALAYSETGEFAEAFKISVDAVPTALTGSLIGAGFTQI